MNPETWDLWMNILRRVPNAVLWLLRLPDEAEAHLHSEAARRGIDPQRIVFTDLLPKVCRVRLVDGLFH